MGNNLDYEGQKRPKLPRGLHWDPKSQFISFNGRDFLGKQHGQSTRLTDPAKALLFKLEFLEKQRQSLGEIEAKTQNTLSLKEVSEMYFNCKQASNSVST